MMTLEILFPSKFFFYFPNFWCYIYVVMASMLKRPTTSTNNNPVMDHQTADPENVLTRSRPFGTSDEVLCTISIITFLLISGFYFCNMSAFDVI